MSKSVHEEPQKRIEELERADAARRGMQEALRKSEEQYRILTEHIAVGVFRSTPGPKGRFLAVNPSLIKMLGYARAEELLNMDVAEIYVNPSDRLGFSDKISRDGSVYHEELTFRKKDGTPIIVSETAIAVKDDHGETLYFDGIVEDITEWKQSEEELKIHKAYLEKLFNSAPEAIVLHDNGDRVVNVNEEFTKMFGYSREEAMGRLINELVASEEFLEDAAFLSNKVIQGERVERETKRRRKDGTIFDVSILGAPIFHNGTQMGVYAIYRDITERKKAEEELRIQKSFFEQLFNNAPEAIVLHDNNDMVVNVNDEFTKVFGYTREEAIGKLINDLVASPEFQEEAALVSQKVIHGERVEFDSKRKRRNGTLVDVSILGAPIFHGGRQMGDYAIYRDITARKLAEEELRIQKTYLENLFNSAPEAIVWHDVNDIVVNVNEEFTRMFGYSRGETIGRPINELVAPDEFQNEASLLSKEVAHGERVEADSKRKRKDGTLIDVSILGAPIFHEGKQIGVFAIYRDITERKKAEEARIRQREEARMARNIQMNFLPKSNPDVAGYDIAGKSIQALNVGGDYYDFIPLDPYRLAIGIGDVSGNGLAASLVMANVQATIRGQALFDPDPAQCLHRANKLLFRSTDSRTFVSLFYGILDTRTHILTYANAGQDLPIIFSSSGESSELKTRGIALGMKEDAVYVTEQLALKEEDLLLIYTDGISEAMNYRREEFGGRKLRETVQEHRRGSASNIIETIIAAVQTHVGHASLGDDMTVVFLKRTGNVR
jgi:PAS domain S-box-containing protein